MGSETEKTRIPLLCGGKSYNGQDIEPEVWESVGPDENAKVVGDKVYWLFGDYTYKVKEYSSGKDITVGSFIIPAAKNLPDKFETRWQDYIRRCRDAMNIIDQMFGLPDKEYVEE
jgi:hypothetical protein